MTLPNLASDYRDINNLLYMSYLPKIINTAVDTGLFETLSERAMSLETLSAALTADGVVLEALLQVLALIDLLEVENGNYALSPLARDFLVEGSPTGQLREVRRYSGSAGPFDHLSKALGGNPRGFSPDMWSSKEMVLHMEQGAKAGSLQAVAAFLTGQPEFAGARRLCDYGGSTGYYSLAFMEKNADLACHVFDLPAVCDIAREVKGDAAHFDRIVYHPCDTDVVDDFGENYDIFFVSNFLYHFSVGGELTNVLKRVARALKPAALVVARKI
jgi:hypothetical protein